MPEARFRYLLSNDAEIVVELITEHRYTHAGIKQDGEKTSEATASAGYNIALQQVRTGFQEMIEGWRRS